MARTTQLAEQSLDVKIYARSSGGQRFSLPRFADESNDSKRVRGTGHVYRDLGKRNADIDQLKAILAAQVIKTLDKVDMT